MRESNSHQRFWRPLSYHLTNPLSKPTCKISFTVAIIHIKATIVKLIVHFYYKEDVYKRQEETPNEEGLKFYDNVIDELRKYNIEPLIRCV